MSNAILYRMPAGIPGTPNRLEDCTIEPQIIMSTNPPLAFGVPVAIDATTQQVRPLGAGDTIANLYGFLVRSYPTQGGAVNEALGTGTPLTSGLCSVLVRGYISIKLNGTTAAFKKGLVYVRIAGAATGKPPDGVEAAADAANTIVLPGNSYFMGPADAQGNTELAFNI